jgi:hypothetical protein
MCPVCAGKDPAACEARFLARLTELGATLAYQSWRGAGKPHEAVCAAGHPCKPRPTDALRGHGICPVCAGKDSATAEAAFRARLAALGAILMEPYHGVDWPHAVRCPEGHPCKPRPTAVLSGHGVCTICAHNGEWNAFYVVASSVIVKFGITSDDPRPRLRAHARSGLTEVLRLWTGLPGREARDTENALRGALELAGEKPVQGREWFDVSCLALIIDIADSWLGDARTA